MVICKRGSGRLCALYPVRELQGKIIRKYTFPHLWKRTRRDHNSGVSARKSGRLARLAEGDSNVQLLELGTNTVLADFTDSPQTV